MTDQTLRRDIAEALLARIKQAVVEPAMPWGGSTTSLLAADGYDPADAVLAVLAIRDAARQAAGQPDTEAAASPVCECQPVRLHDDYREAAVYLHEATCPTVGQPAAAAETPLTDAERQFLTFALDLADNRMANRSDEFDTEDYAALARLRQLAEEGAL